jgi:hypothetical protein
MINPLALVKEYQAQDRAAETGGLQNQLLRFKLMSAEEDRRREQQKRNALAQMGGNLNPNALMGIDPELGIKMQALTQKDRLAREQMMMRNQFQNQTMQMRQQQANKPVWDSSRGVWVAQPGSGGGVQQTMGGGVVRPAGLPMSKAEMKEQEEEKKAEQRLSNAMTKADIVTGKVDEALKQTGFFSTGVQGAILGNIPGTNAYDLDRTLDTIKANIGFKELQDMREASPTGGALGQVAVQELTYLQSALSSLDKGQSRPQLERNLKAVKQHYDNWKKAVGQARQQPGQQKGGSSIDALLEKYK